MTATAMPEQAEFDPILENAVSILAELKATLDEFSPEATVMDATKLTENLNAIAELRRMIELTHSGDDGHYGVSLSRVLAILCELNNAIIFTKAWLIQNCARLALFISSEKRDETTLGFSLDRADEFQARLIAANTSLRDVTAQLYGVALRLALASDELLNLVIPKSVEACIA